MKCSSINLCSPSKQMADTPCLSARLRKLFKSNSAGRLQGCFVPRPILISFERDSCILLCINPFGKNQLLVYATNLIDPDDVMVDTNPSSCIWREGSIYSIFLLRTNQSNRQHDVKNHLYKNPLVPPNW